jgi:Tfp pilus assembly protein PilZ
MQILKGRYRTKEEFLGSLVSASGELAEQDPDPLVFVGVREPIGDGEAVLVEVRFPELTDRSILRGEVVWRRSGARGQRAGVAVRLEPTERHKLDFLRAVARGVGRSWLRNHRRLPVALACDWRVIEARDHTPAELSDIGPGGAFVRTLAPAPEGTAIVIAVIPPGAAAPLSIEGRVAWARSENGESGMGVEFRCRDTGGLRRLKELVRRLEQGPEVA